MEEFTRYVVIFAAGIGVTLGVLVSGALLLAVLA